MAADFDPYYVWLSIPPEEQPANYYRLLCLRLFEANADVIDGAADRQMAHLRTFQGGKHGDLTQRLLNEVAAARICLLDPKKRAAYDQQLRAKQSPTTGTSVGDSGLGRPPAGRAAVALPPVAPPPLASRAANVPMAALAPQSAEVWDDLLGKSNGKSPATAVHASAKSAAAKQKTANRGVAYGIAGAVAFVTAIAVGAFLTNRPAATADATLVFNLLPEDRANATVTVDDAPVPPPTDGRWKYHCAAGLHHVAVQRTGHEFSADVTIAAGQEQEISPQWRPKGVLALNWPLELRSGATLKIDGRLQDVTEHMPLEIAVEPGRHSIEITRPGFTMMRTTATVAPAGRAIVAIAPPPTLSPPTLPPLTPPPPSSSGGTPHPESRHAGSGISLRFTRWTYASDETGKSGYFEKRGDEWVEVKDGRVWAHFMESARTAKYVELFDGSRGVAVRLSTTEAVWSRNRSDWLLAAKGSPAAE